MSTPYLREIFRRDGIDPAAFDRRIIELRKMGLSFPVIAKVVSYYEGWFVTEYQVEERLRRLGAPKNPKRQRAGYEIAAKRATA